MAVDKPFQVLQQTIWDARLPLEIRLAAAECRIFDQADPYLVSWPRVSYLPLVLPRLHAFFANDLIADASTVDPGAGYFSYDGVPLKWHYPLGLLYDMYVLAVQDPNVNRTSNTLPLKLTVHFAPDKIASTISPSPIVMHDSFINSVKEADFLRSGTAKPIMTLPTSDSKALWISTQENDLPTYSRIYQSLLPSTGHLRNIPLRIFMPSSSADDPGSAQMRIFQAHVPPTITAISSPNPASARIPTSSQPQTLGTALNTHLPGLFPSRRTPISARPLLHGATLPMTANLEELAKWACYADGWLSVVIAING